MRQLQKFCKPRKVTIADAKSEPRSERSVSNGALLRWHELKDRGFTPDGTFGIAMIENYDPVVHADATVMNGRVERDRFTDELIVYERWLPLTDKVSIL